MTDPSESQDQPPAVWRRFTSDEEAANALPAATLEDPVVVGNLFCSALDDHVHFRAALEKLTTPESRSAWGDFSAAADFLASIEDRGTGSVADRALGADDVAYFKILRDVKQSYQVLDGQPMFVSGIITLVWRPEVGSWLVHSIGTDHVLPEEIPGRPAD